MSETPSATLGRYQIIREIARSNDIVYEAYDPQMNRRVALKEMYLQPGASDAQRRERRDRFLREARAAGSLAHPNIVTIYEVGEESGRLYIAMEYLEGKTLRNELDTAGFLPAMRALEICEEVLHALDYAHKRGVVHRDIKPENVQLLDNGQVKITDFGIARLTFEPNLTLDGQVFGTPSYMSPEQVVGKEIDARSDLFSVGVVLYEMISGKKPFSGDHVVSITYSIMNRPPEPLLQAHPAVAEVIGRALEKTAAMRFASASEMLRAVEDAKRALNTPVPDPSWMGMTGAYGAYPFTIPGAPSAHVPPGSIPPPPPPGPNVFYSGSPYPSAQQPYGPLGSSPPQTSHPLGSQHPVPPHLYPMYFALPPAKPWISPATQAFLGRLLATLFLLAMLFVLVPVIIGALASALQPKRGGLEDLGPRAPVQSGARTEAERSAARSRAIAAVARAEAEPSALVAATIWEEAGNLYLRAEGGGGESGNADAGNAAICFYNAAAKLIEGGGDISKARNLLFDAKFLSRSDPGLQQAIDHLLERAGG